MTNRSLLIAELVQDEGIRLTCYDDATGKPLTPGTALAGHPTIGIGRALDVNGISQAEAYYLLGNDIDRTETELLRRLPWLTEVDEERRRVLLNMAFNLGIDGLMQFHDTLRYVEEGRYELAARSMEGSKWYRQVGARAVRLAARMRVGEVVQKPLAVS